MMLKVFNITGIRTMIHFALYNIYVCLCDIKKLHLINVQLHFIKLIKFVMYVRYYFFSLFLIINYRLFKLKVLFLISNLYKLIFKLKV